MSRERRLFELRKDQEERQQTNQIASGPWHSYPLTTNHTTRRLICQIKKIVDFSFRDAWIAGVNKHFPGTPKPGYVAP
jgi:hypothetical protein